MSSTDNLIELNLICSDYDHTINANQSKKNGREEEFLNEQNFQIKSFNNEKGML